MPSRKAMMLPASLSGGQLELFCEKQPRWMNITFGDYFHSFNNCLCYDR